MSIETEQDRFVHEFVLSDPEYARVLSLYDAHQHRRDFPDYGMTPEYCALMNAEFEGGLDGVNLFADCQTAEDRWELVEISLECKLEYMGMFELHEKGEAAWRKHAMRARLSVIDGGK